jgi:hypothetical protein
MLARAAGRREQLAPALREALRFKHGDARSVRVAGKFDAVISLFHVLSYQQTNADVRAMLATAVAHLPVGAPFLFDFWYGPAVLVQRPETRVKMLEDERILVTRIARSVLRENDDLVEVHYDILVEEKSSRVTRRIEETHVMRYFFLPELDLLLEGAGLRRVHATEWAGEGPLSHRSWGGFAIAQKVAD